jgi:CDGSH-type Zn-finger protein
MANVKITARNNGPLKVEGPIDLYYGETKIEVKDPSVSLCRCGASANKPFCDGTHNKIGFQASTEPAK